MQTTPNDHAGRPGLATVAEGAPDEMESLALVLEAVGIPFRYNRHDGQLLVAVRDAPAALFHLEEYRRENLCRPPLLPQPSPVSQSRPTLFALLCLALFFAHTGSWAPANDWFIRGALNNTAVFGHGEWWRLFTALTLHTDPGHLLANCLIGGMVIHMLARMIGFGQCWLLLITIGGIANLVNIGMRRELHLSVGFSTSVFAAVGLLTGLQLARSSHRPARALLLPLGAGAGLLAFLGSEGGQTDLGAHFFGFICGIACGWMGGWCGIIARLQTPAWQFFYFFLALAVPIMAWVRALA